MENPLPEMAAVFGITETQAWLLLVVPTFDLGVAGSDTTFSRQSVVADLRAAIEEDPSDREAVEDLIIRLTTLNITHIGYYVLGVRSMREHGEVFARP